MSIPQAARRTNDSSSSAFLAVKGFVCPKCRRRFEEAATGNPTQCPDDLSPLVRVRDMTEADGDPMLGRTLDGRFTILARLGAGSMGTVYRARQHTVARDVAVKILRSDRAVDSAAKGRFLREARANSVLTSPHTVTVFDFGQSDSGEFYLVMELLEGESLGQRLKRAGRVSVEASVETARQALRSLAEAHAKGIVHRDLKPDNLFYARVRNGERYEEIVKVVDFGIAKMLHGEGAQMNAVETQAGTVFGTPRYMSPEQAQGKPLDARSDLYSLGVILYHMLTGRPPFTDDDAIVVMARHIKTMPKPPSEVAPDAHIPVDLESTLMRILAKEPPQRPDTADAMSNELARALELGVAASSGVRSISASPIAFARPPGLAEKASPGSAAPQSTRSPARQPTPSRPDESLTATPSQLPRSRTGLVIALFAIAGALGAAAIVYFGIVRGAADTDGTPPRLTASAPGTATAPAATVAQAPTQEPTSARVTPTTDARRAPTRETIPTVAIGSLPVTSTSAKATAAPTAPTFSPTVSPTFNKGPRSPAVVPGTAAPTATAPTAPGKYEKFDR